MYRQGSQLPQQHTRLFILSKWRNMVGNQVWVEEMWLSGLGRWDLTPPSVGGDWQVVKELKDDRDSMATWASEGGLDAENTLLVLV
jgi:hypothetical protein